MDYSLLKNKVYLTLLAFYNNFELPSFVALGKEIGISRQTASTRVKELINAQIIELDEENRLQVHNPLNIDVVKLQEYLNECEEFNPVDLKAYLFRPAESKAAAARELGMSRAQMYVDYASVVYGICSEGKIKYVGTTAHFERRISQHIAKRPYLTRSNFIILADENVQKDKFKIENELIDILQPEWNIMGKD